MFRTSGETPELARAFIGFHFLGVALADRCLESLDAVAVSPQPAIDVGAMAQALVLALAGFPRDFVHYDIRDPDFAIRHEQPIKRVDEPEQRQRRRIGHEQRRSARAGLSIMGGPHRFPHARKLGVDGFSRASGFEVLRHPQRRRVEV